MKEELNPKQSEHSRHKWYKGFTLIELLIIIAIIALLSVVLFAAFSGNLSKARDAQRKDDLEELRVAFEDYYNDNGCYPDFSKFEVCGSEELRPYLRSVPCDPADDFPYRYFSLGGNECRGYRVLVQLENTNDPNIESMGCDAVNGCYYEDFSYNFGIAMGGTLTGDNWVEEAGPEAEPTPTPIPTPTPTPPPSCDNGQWVISPNGSCSCYIEDYLPTANCPATYDTFDECFSVSGCYSSCTEDDVPLNLRCTR